MPVDAGLQPVHFDEQYGRGVLGNAAGVDSGFDRLNGVLVDHLQGRGYDAPRNDAGNRLGRFRHRIVNGQKRFHRRRRVQQANSHFGRDSQGSLGTDEGSHQVETDRVSGRGSQSVDFAVRQHGLQFKHMVGGDAILERVRTAGVFGHVAPDGRRNLA